MEEKYLGKTGLALLWAKLKEKLALKQDALIGLEGQLVGFDADGQPTAQDSWQSNRNLLDNWYFAAPVDQRDEYVVPPGTAYYSDTGLTAKVGTLSAYARFIAANSTYGKITLNGTDYYTATSAARHGYVSTAYRSTIDRWMADSGCFVRESSGLIAKSSGASIRQLMESKAVYAGKTLTASVLLETTGLVTATITNFNTSNTLYFGSDKTIIAQGEYGNRFFELVLPADEHVIAAKVELGSRQTLARKDADGSWVLNDAPPHQQQELAKCQRYLDICRVRVPANASLWIPYHQQMRTAPALTFAYNEEGFFEFVDGTITKDGFLVRNKDTAWARWFAYLADANV